MDWNLAYLPFIPALPFGAGLIALFTKSRSLAGGLVFSAVLVSLILSGIVAYDQQRRSDGPEAGGIISRNQPHVAIGGVYGPVSVQAVGGAISGVRLGMDGLNAGLVILTALVGALTVLASWRLPLNQAHHYFGCLGCLIGLTLLAFLAQDLLVFYVGFELTLVPLFLLVGQWGGPNRQAASTKMIIYTLSGGFLTLLGILGLAVQSGGGIEFGWEELARLAARLDEGSVSGKLALPLLFLLICAGFVVKIPLIPFHSWQPVAYAEAPTPVTAFLSAVLAKLGLYGILRVAILLMPVQAASIGVTVLVPLAVLSILYGAFCAFGARDLKSILAYGSISHLGYALLGMLSLNRVGIEGALLHMIGHGVVTAGMLFAAGMLQEREGSLLLANLGGLAARYRVLGAFMVLFALASVGVPGLAQFVGEFLCLVGYLGSAEYGQGLSVAICVLAGLFLGGWYTVTMLQRVFFGPLKSNQSSLSQLAENISSRMTLTEWCVLTPLALLTVLLGIFPQPVLKAPRTEAVYLEREVKRVDALSFTKSEGAASRGLKLALSKVQD